MLRIFLEFRTNTADNRHGGCSGVPTITNATVNLSVYSPRFQLADGAGTPLSRAGAARVPVSVPPAKRPLPCGSS